jgi:hypothetical protein
MRGRELADRLAFDYRVLASMRSASFDFEAYRTTWELERRTNPVREADDTSQAKKYRLILRVPTLVSATEYQAETEVGVDVDVVDYPERAPMTFLLSGRVPWSTHFHRRGGVCIGGEFWEARGGHIVLGELVVHLQRVLNWDEKGRDPNYTGFNPAAVRHHREVLGNRPLDPSFVYAVLPSWLGGNESEPSFEISDRSQRNWGFEVQG